MYKKVKWQDPQFQQPYVDIDNGGISRYDIGTSTADSRVPTPDL
ncbi:hypothetical protein ACFPYJ_18750 [Paenibacillus solisilvae]|uniref:Paeninodin family lasso peptide n=1 Tax=Paenibacillus solisilvae TaxID=2486751 RepID=A0ABW0VZQ3_9BACL